MLETRNTLAKIAANTFASFTCLQPGGSSTTFHCYFSAAYALATSPPTSSPGATYHFKACCALSYQSPFLPPTDLAEKQARHATMQGRDGLVLWVLCCLTKTLMLCTSFTDLSLTVVIKLQNDDPDNAER